MRDPLLLTPGPATTDIATKAAMLRDWGSWDDDFRAVTADIRRRLLAILGPAGTDFECVPMQGSGSFVVEAMLGTLVPPDGKALVLMNGAYGQRIARTLRVMGRAPVVLDKGDYLPPTPDEVDALLTEDATITHVVVVHCETSSGILNPIEAIADVVARHGRRLLVDAMSSFGALDLDPARIRYDAVVASANKCLEGVPGFGWALVRRDALEAAAGNAHSLSLDLVDQWRHMEATGQWRFTPPTHVVVALAAALDAYEAEGGLTGRGARYQANRAALVEAMAAIGIRPFLDADVMSPIIVTFRCPDHPAFDFPTFYQAVKRRGFVLYPGKLTEAETFRVGCIGQVFPADVRAAVAAMADACAEMGVSLPGPVEPSA
jgi:2-aminoethylphosphonate-pyruvate transaminase